MVRTTLETGGNPFADEDGDVSRKVRNWLDVVSSHVLELFESGLAGQLVLDADPFCGIASCRIIYYGTKEDLAHDGARIAEAEKVVREAEAALDSSGRDLGGGVDRTEFEIARAKAGFSDQPVWIGGPGPSELFDIYWSEADHGVTHDMLMEACDGISAEYRRLIHRNVGSLAALRHRTPTVTDLYNALLIYKAHIPHEDELVEQINARFGPDAVWPTAAPAECRHTVWNASEPPGALESAYADDARSVVDVVEALEGAPPTTGPSSCGRSWDEAGEEPDILDPSRKTEREAIRQRNIEEFENIFGEPQEAPKPVGLSPYADASETGSSAPPAAPGGNSEAELAGDAHEWEALTRQLADPRPLPAGPGQSNSTFIGRFPAVAVSKPIED